MEYGKKVALITGASRGLGLAISKRLAQDGVIVVMTDINATEVSQAAKSIKNGDTLSFGYALNVKNQVDIKNTIQEVVDKFGKIDILINNAGISPKINNEKRNLINTPLEEWNEVIQVNLTGAFLCTQEVLPFMMSQNWGRIINISSQAGRTFSRVAGVHYASSKSGLIGLTRITAYEYGSYGITANSIAPGRVKSPMVEAVDDVMNEEFVNISPLNRLGNPEEVASAVAYLCDEDAGYITGATIDVNGGMFMN